MVAMEAPGSFPFPAATDDQRLMPAAGRPEGLRAQSCPSTSSCSSWSQAALDLPAKAHLHRASCRHPQLERLPRLNRPRPRSGCRQST